MVATQRKSNKILPPCPYFSHRWDDKQMINPIILYGLIFMASSYGEV